MIMDSDRNLTGFFKRVIMIETSIEGMDAPIKILIIYANSGAGHRRAAEALYAVIGEYFPRAEIKILDALDYSTPVFQKGYPQSYLFMVNYCPWLWGIFYYFLDNRLVDRISRLFRRTTNNLNCQKFVKLILDEKPELIITTHFLPNEIIAHLKKRHGLKTFLATCITDYYPHTFWREREIDLFFTPNEELTPRLVQLGISAEKIKPFGIPVHPAFAENVSKAKIRQELGLDTDQFTVLITSGGFGVGPVEELVAELSRITTPFQALVVCGNNPPLQEEISRITAGTIHQFKIYGFVENMFDLMNASDLLITKPGGLTSTEAMAKGLPLLIFYPIPGQESSNCDFIVRHQAGVRVKNGKQARRLIETMVTDPEQLAILEENIKKLGRPQSARNIISYLKDLLGKEKKDQLL